jgi:hypothetical protein
MREWVADWACHVCDFYTYCKRDERTRSERLQQVARVYLLGLCYPCLGWKPQRRWLVWSSNPWTSPSSVVDHSQIVWASLAGREPSPSLSLSRRYRRLCSMFVAVALAGGRRCCFSPVQSSQQKPKGRWAVDKELDK